MKARKHHNNKGERQIRRGKTEDQVRALAKKLGLKYVPKVKTVLTFPGDPDLELK